MNAFDNLKNKAAELLEQAKGGLESVSDTVIEKAGDAVDSVTGGSFSEQIDSVQGTADDAVPGKDA